MRTCTFGIVINMIINTYWVLINLYNWNKNIMNYTVPSHSHLQSPKNGIMPLMTPSLNNLLKAE